VRPRQLKRLFDRRDEILDAMQVKYLEMGTVTKVTTSRGIATRGSSAGQKKK